MMCRHESIKKNKKSSTASKEVKRKRMDKIMSEIRVVVLDAAEESSS